MLVTGPTGSGKSTTLCAMIDYINRTRNDHIITIEDPIEFVHENKQCLINQREVGTHTGGFKDALRAAMREDPDIILVGELRDLETVAIAIETAETGHLVFGTLHTTTAASTVDRVIDQFPTEQQAQIRIMLSESLKGVIAQNLCRKIGGGRVAALEVLLINSAISNLIREGKTFQIPSMMQVGRAQGMVALNDALMDLVTKKLVEPEEAYCKAVDKAAFEGLLKRANIDTKFVSASRNRSTGLPGSPTDGGCSTCCLCNASARTARTGSASAPSIFRHCTRYVPPISIAPSGSVQRPTHSPRSDATAHGANTSIADGVRT